MATGTTLIVSDVHLMDVGLTRLRPQYYKRPERMVDGGLVHLLERITATRSGPHRLIINGDFIDFDLVPAAAATPIAADLERLERVIADHRDLFTALGRFVRGGGELVLVVGNHDLALVRPALQTALVAALARLAGTATADIAPRLQVCPWFFRDGDELYVEHGNRFDRFSSVPDPLDPFLPDQPDELFLPFGSHTNRQMTSHMGSFNPFDTNQVVLRLPGYLLHWLRFYRLPPWRLPAAYLRGAIRAYWRMRRDAASAPDASEPARAARAVAHARTWGLDAPQASALWALSAPPLICVDPFRAFRELWLDRTLWYFALAASLGVATVTPLPLVLRTLLPASVLIALRRYERHQGPSQVLVDNLAVDTAAERLAAITGARRVVLGHTHRPVVRHLEDGRRIYNVGTWAPVCKDAKCRHPVTHSRHFLLVHHDGDVTDDVFEPAWGPARLSRPRPDPLAAVARPVLSPVLRIAREAAPLLRRRASTS